jgi:cell division protein FtsA
MNSENPIGIIELGNINLRCLIFRIDRDNKAEILSTSITPSEGIHNDVIVNLSKASKAVRFCIGKSEKKAKVLLKKINIVFEQTEFLCTKFSKHKKIDGSKIHKDDVTFLLKEAKKEIILNDKKQHIIHIFNHNYIVDGKIFVEEPINVYADSLTHEMTFITIPENNLKNINQVFNDCDIEIERLISRSFSLGAKLLNPQELEFGSSIIDLGFEKISLGLFKHFALVHSTTVPIGVNHMVKDVAKVCSLSLEESQNIINNIDFSFEKKSKLFDEKNYLKDTYFLNSKFRKISESLIINIIRARLDEIFESLKKQLIVPGFNLKSGINLIITGGGSNLLNIDKYFIDFFGSNVKTTFKNNLKTNEDLDANFAPCIGALKIIKDGWETEAIPEIAGNDIEKMGLFAKIFKIT